MITLASKSHIRSILLQNAGVPHDVKAATIDEIKLQKVMSHLRPVELAKELSRAKALSVSSLDRHALVIGADQILESNDSVLHKCTDMAAARKTLQHLRGQTHFLHSAVSVTQGTTLLLETVETAALTMRDFTDDFMDSYLAEHGENILSSVGCYQLEGAGINLFETIEGDYFTILGLPLLPLLAFLREIGELPS